MLNMSGQEDRKTLTESYVRADVIPCQDGLTTIGDCLEHYARELPDKNAVVFRSRNMNGDRNVVTYSELYEKSCRVARSLISLGIRPGECVAVNIEPCPEWLFIVFGSILAGAQLAMLSFTFKDGSDIIGLTKQVEKCALLVLDAGHDNEKWDIAEQLIDRYDIRGQGESSRIPYLRYLIGHKLSSKIEPAKTIHALLAESHSEVNLPQINPNDVAFLFQTSGSTGLRKLVAHTHRSTVSVRKLITIPYFRASDVVYNDRPFFWISGFPFTLFTGQTHVTMCGYGTNHGNRIQRVVKIIQEEKINVALLLPADVVELNHMQNCLPTNWNLDAIMTGGQPLKQILTGGIGKVCQQLVCAYGSTEFICLLAKPIKSKGETYCCVGQPIHGTGTEVKIVDRSGKTVPVETRGEIYVKCPTMFKEYFNDVEKTTAVIEENGWYQTDDIGWIDGLGEVHVEGRLSNMIIHGGCNVAPEVLEQLIESCPGVEQVVVVPVDDEVYYQDICACIIKEEGRELTETDIRNYCEKMMSYRRREFTNLPKYYLFMQTFPLMVTGKLSRRDLVKIANEKFKK